VAISRASNSSIQGGLPKFNDIWDGTTATSAFDSLGVVLLSSTASSITFSSIPQTYTHLQIYGSLKSNRSTYVDDLGIRFNGDSASNYSFRRMYGVGSSTAQGDNNTSAASMNLCQIAGGTVNNSNGFGGIVLEIVDYSSTVKTKSVKSFSGYEDNGQGIVQLASGNWRNSNTGISSITLIPLFGTLFSANSEVSLYGIK
jgi:hypothetical protein